MITFKWGDGSDGVGEWIALRAGGKWTPGRGATLGVLSDGNIIAGFGFYEFRGGSVFMDVASDLSGRWLNRRIGWELFRYLFRHLGCEVVLGWIDEVNRPSLNFARRAGFTEVAWVPDAARSGRSLILMSLRREDCKWLPYLEKRYVDF